MRSLGHVLLRDPTRGKALLLDLAGDESEDEALLDAIGRWLVELIQVGVVDEFDLRDITSRVVNAHLYEPED